MPIIPALRRLRKENPEFEARLGYRQNSNQFQNSQAIMARSVKDLLKHGLNLKGLTKKLTNSFKYKYT
jgi:hypothetical protein